MQGPVWVWLFDPSEVLVGEIVDFMSKLTSGRVRRGEVGDVVGGEEERVDEEEGNGVEGSLLREGVVKIGCAKWTTMERGGA